MLQLAVTGDSFFIYNNYPVNWKDCVLVFATGNISGILNSDALNDIVESLQYRHRTGIKDGMGKILS